MKKITIILLSIVFPIFGFSQITFTSSDLPHPDDTMRFSRAITTGSVDFTLTGNNHTWDFSSLTPVSQRVDSFISVTSTPATYQLYFNNSWLYPNNKASVAGLEENMDTVSMYQITNIHNFYREKNNKFELVGYGGELNGMPVPIRFDTNDVIYHLPVSINSQPDSSYSSYALSVPGIGYVGQKKKRIITVDGWGTLTTPYGTFNTLRLKSYIHQVDSVHIDSMAIALPAIERNTVEYSWLANGYGKPVLRISTMFGFPTNIEYLDSARVIINSTDNIISESSKFSIFPNPASEKITIERPTEFGNYTVKIFDTKGVNVYKEKISEKQTTINPNLKNGLYLLIIETNKYQSTHKIVIKSN